QEENDQLQWVRFTTTEEEQQRGRLRAMSLVVFSIPEDVMDRKITLATFYSYNQPQPSSKQGEVAVQHSFIFGLAERKVRSKGQVIGVIQFPKAGNFPVMETLTGLEDKRMIPPPLPYLHKTHFRNFPFA